MSNVRNFTLLMAVVALAGCAADLDKAPASDGELDDLVIESADLRADRIDTTFRGELAWDELQIETLTRRVPYHTWIFWGTAGRSAFIDLASREGDDMFVALYVQSGNGYRLIALNDDCYSGTLNACLDVVLPEGDHDHYLVLASTYSYIRRGIPTPATYHLRLSCRDGRCNDDDAMACGSRGLPECSRGMYCAFPAGQCGADDRGGRCELVPYACAEIYEPVCGCDGRNYPNPCAAAQHGISVASSGECPVDSACEVSGCSGQLCVEAGADIVTTCEWREEYACYRSASCERQADGRCGWTDTAELRACLDGARL